MVFDSVQWGKVRPTITGTYKEIRTKAKSWASSWEHEGIGVGLITVVSMVAAYAGANFIAPAILNSAAMTGATYLTTMAVKSAATVVTQQFAVGLATTGSFEGAMKAVFSSETVVAAAMNLAISSIVHKLAGP